MTYQVTDFEAAMQIVEQDDHQLRKGTWLEEEDERLVSFVKLMGDKKWDALAKSSGLRRSGKSCRLRWMNYLRPNLKHGRFSVEEEKIILQLHEQWGNKWSKIARRLPGRTDNEIKNYWRTNLKKKVVQVEENEIKKAKLEDKYSNPKHNHENTHHDQHCGSISAMEGLLGTSWGGSSEASASSADFVLTGSPYENRLSDWISEYSNSQSDASVSMEYSSSSCFLECDWTVNNHVSDYSDSLDCSGFLWDMN